MQVGDKSLLLLYDGMPPTSNTCLLEKNNLPLLCLLIITRHNFALTFCLQNGGQKQKTNGRTSSVTSQPNAVNFQPSQNLEMCHTVVPINISNTRCKKLL